MTHDSITINLNTVVQVITVTFGLYVAYLVYRSAKKKDVAFLLPPLGWLLAGVVASVSGTTILIYVAVFWLVHDGLQKKEADPDSRKTTRGM